MMRQHSDSRVHRRADGQTAARVRIKRASRTAAESDLDVLVANARQASGFLKALSHEGRLMILCLLASGEKSVTEIEQMLSLRQPAVSQQLARLRSEGLVDTRRNGKNMYYSIARSEVRELKGH
jgi:DNA-binding MarR family transcriptional regulator